MEQIVAAHGDYLLVVKQSQPTLRQDICLAFGVLPPVGSWECEFWDYQSFSCQVRQGGRLETRLLESTTALNDYLTWPGVGQILRRTCHTVHRRTGQVQHQVHYAITSLSRERVTLAQVEQFWRWHWTIENCTHYVRDVSFGEDQAQLRSGHAPQALATLRNAVISLLRLEGWSYMPNAFRYFSQSVQLPLRLVGALET